MKPPAPYETVKMREAVTVVVLASLLGWASTFGAQGVPEPRPSTRIPSALYAARDLDAIGKALDDFDGQVARQGIDLRVPGYEVEIRLVGRPK